MPRRPAFDETTKMTIRTAYSSGQSVAELALRYHVAQPTIYRTIRQDPTRIPQEEIARRILSSISEDLRSMPRRRRFELMIPLRNQGLSDGALCRLFGVIPQTFSAHLKKLTAIRGQHQPMTQGLLNQNESHTAGAT